jgi:uncharacterized coiled-coil protein SlyX
MADHRAESERVQRLEESQGFSERAIEQLSTEVRELGKRVQDLAVKLGRLEARLDAAQRNEEE